MVLDLRLIKIGCRETVNLFLYPLFFLHKYPKKSTSQRVNESTVVSTDSTTRVWCNKLTHNTVGAQYFAPAPTNSAALHCTYHMNVPRVSR